MDVTVPDWSSGCESGWTSYFDESYVYPRDSDNNGSVLHEHQNYRVNSVSCEEDLSMVSDASSGPPHLHYDEHDDGYGRTRRVLEKSLKKEKRSKKEIKKKLSKQYEHQHLDDTASSPVISYDKIYENPSTNEASVMGFSQNLSQAHFQGNTAVSNHHYGFWMSSNPNNVDSAEPSTLRGRRW